MRGERPVDESGHGPDDLAEVVRQAGITDERLLRAIRATPRADFVPASAVSLAYFDQPIPIGHDQVTTQPSLSAAMVESLELTGTEHVLEVGTGLGFQTALLAALAADVVTIDIWADLAEQARRNLDRRGVRNVESRVGDGSAGVPERAPYDAIIVSAAYPTVPPPLAEQLRPGGRLVQPIGPGGHDQVVLFHRTDDRLERRRVITPAWFVRLRGVHGFSD
ncbi:protein-L-isoaspartate(D-aspartate) O-methyltransferase [Thermopolyspora sp. NPDC052614]|uniref:protein-L-isoaspartate(D-aspartate) O-methyltransferase n=1 Tax=Thermopolyspora sp. NPDC052614 TaxID=3155682 RepID=UPI003425A535